MRKMVSTYSTEKATAVTEWDEVAQTQRRLEAALANSRQAREYAATAGEDAALLHAVDAVITSIQATLGALLSSGGAR